MCFLRFMVIGFVLVVIIGMVWFLQGEANDKEREKRLRAVAGGDAWLDDNLAWVEDGEGNKSEGRAVWLGKIDRIVRTKPTTENAIPELIALELIDAERISGSSAKESKLW